MASTAFSFAGTPSSSSSSSSFSFASSNPSSAPSAPSFGFGAATTLSASATSPFDASSPPAATTPSAITSPFGAISGSSSSSDFTPTISLFGPSLGTAFNSSLLGSSSSGATTPSMFGSRSGPTTNLFGASSGGAPSPSFFGSLSSGATQSTYSPFAFNSSTAAQSSPAPSQFPFGTLTLFGSPAPGSSNLFGSVGPTPSLFGNSSAAPSSSAGTSLFGGSAATTPATIGPLFKSGLAPNTGLFGSSKSPPNAASTATIFGSASAPTAGIFGSSTTSSLTTTPSLFSVSSGSIPSQGQTGSSSLFGSSSSFPSASTSGSSAPGFSFSTSSASSTPGFSFSLSPSSTTTTTSGFSFQKSTNSSVASASATVSSSSSSGFSFGTAVAPSSALAPSASKPVTFGPTSSPVFSTVTTTTTTNASAPAASSASSGSSFVSGLTFPAFSGTTSSTASAAAVANASTPSSSLTGFGQISTLASASGNTSSLSLSLKSPASSASQTQSSTFPSFGGKTFDFWPGSSNLANQSSASALPKRRASPAHAPESSKKKRRVGFLFRPSSSSPVDYSFLDCRDPRLCQQMRQSITFPCDVAIAGKLPPETRRDEIYHHLSKAMALAATDPGPNIKSLHEKINQLQSEVEDLLARDKNREESFSKFMKTYEHDFEKERACHQAEVLKLSNQVVVAFDVGVRVGVKNFFESAKGKLFMEQACSAFVDRYKKSKAMLRDIAPMLLTYFVRAIQLSQEVINDAQASVTLDCTILKQRLKDEYPGFNGNPNESADFAWWECVIAELITPWLTEPSSNKGKQSFDEGITADISSQPIDQSTIDAPEAEINHPSFLDSPSTA